jgi:hypothetical protein
MVDADRSVTMTDHAVVIAGGGADRPDAVGERALAASSSSNDAPTTRSTVETPDGAEGGR